MPGIYDISRRARVREEDVKAVFDALVGLVREGERVTIKGIGSFTSVVRKKRTFKSPVTGDYPIPAHRSMVFRPIRELRFLDGEGTPQEPVKRTASKISTKGKTKRAASRSVKSED